MPFQSSEKTRQNRNSRLIKIVNGRIVRNHTIINDDVLYIHDGKIIDPQNHFFACGNPPDVVINAKGLLIAPGYIDVQINGAFGVDFSVWKGDKQMKEGLDKIAKGLVKYGWNKDNGAEVLGVHVEGPFITSSQLGAHEESCLRAAPNGINDFVDIYGLHELKDNPIKIITVAPDVEGVLDSLEELVNFGITVSIGHSSATVFQAESAIEKGAKCITHLFNAMQQFHHRDPGIVGLLGTTRITRPFYGIICDGIHVHPNSIKIAYDSHPKGAILVTDAMAALGLPPGEYTLGGISVRKSGNEKVEVVENGKLAGSVISIDACVKNFKKFTGCSVIEAIEAATLHPAELLGIQNFKGTLNVGADADFVFLDDDLNVVKCFIAGEEISTS
ncbi:Metallo-dependent hydrolase [Rhizophagus irregularis]|uniref:N-acetylglucosamine-6-phosphate deacetylase n=1 Tax=Rhizophagus irregularis TaxID=588596 RepID=A0A2I1FSI7_9GLOM|nr:Metallo-dependent hydrolase [Rhizophagus irregularis]